MSSRPTEEEIQQPAEKPLGFTTVPMVWDKNCVCGDRLDKHGDAGECLVCDCEQFRVRGWVAIS